ncbi:helix-turn-helix transcriptional regulator (plasmid) [Streptomyces sp. NBC_01255]|uniref:helix-turn-helix domain-containing protein n=1 Tax=Streptomyces sp. NBC_01255 TaxID=2903798 RepID=UPI002E3592AA|nr:helix-turn-helix transcriptional regulator [Streptomyces sp. NBC_01255]
MPRPDSALGQLAQALRAARQAKGLTQEQAGEVMDVSSSTVQRAEAGRRAPEKYVVDSYVRRLGLNSDQAEQMWVEASRPAGRQRRTLTPAPAVHLVQHRHDFSDALRRVREESSDQPPSMAAMEERAEAAFRRNKDRFAPLSRSAANRIYNRRQLPSSIRQLCSYLHACHVPERQFRDWIAAYHRVKAKEHEEAVAKKRAAKEAREQWSGWAGRSRAEAVLRAAGLDPVERPPRSPGAPWSARCSRCGQVSRVRLTRVVQERAGCPLCGQDIGHVRDRRPIAVAQERPGRFDCSAC